MKLGRSLQTFVNRYPLVGPLLWLMTIQYYLVQSIVALAWPTPYSLLHNTLSNLGDTGCGLHSGIFVCSPLHDLMNISFVMLGITMGMGALLIHREFPKTRGTAVGFGAMGIAGFGPFLIGVFPENVEPTLHFIGGSLSFVVGNLGLIMLGVALPLPKLLRYFTFVGGAVALAALVLFQSEVYLELGRGGMERIVAYPQTLWIMAFGIYLSTRRVATIVRQHALPSLRVT